MNNIKPLRVSRSDASALRARFAQRRAEEEVAKEVADIKADMKDRKISEGETLRLEMLADARSAGARPGAGDRYQGLGGFDETLLRR
jgi:hypothetical protein